MPSLLTVIGTLQLAVDDMVKEVKNLRDALNTTSEILKLLKYSPKRDRIEKNALIVIMTPEKQDKTLELSKHWSPDSTPARNDVIMKTTYPVNQ